MNADSAFFQRSVRVAAAFLQTAVVIDDRAFRDRRAATESSAVELAPPPTPMTAHPVAVASPIALEPTIAAVEQADAETTKDPDPHGIDAEVVIASFAQHGIVCSVLRRGNEDATSTQSLARQLLPVADILIVDWQVHHANGSDTAEETLRFIDSAVSDGLREAPHQLRLIVIYTGATNLFTVVDVIGERLQTAARKPPPQKDGDFAFQVGSMRIVVLGKASRYRAADQRTQQVDDDSELSTRAIQEFAVMTAGLVSNVALESLAQVRRATHGILTRFGQDLDAPFLAHRAMLTPPTEGDDHLIPLIVSEFEAILHDQVSPDLLSDQSIGEWIETRGPALHMIDSAPDINTEEKARTAILQICLTGVHNHANYSIPTQPTWIKRIADGRGVADIGKLANLIAAENAADGNEKLEVLMSFRPRYGDSPPMLTLGALLRSTEHGNEHMHWLCLQPACDCYLRAGNPRRAFPLLRVKNVTERFNLIAEIDGTFIRLRWEPRPYKIQMFEFEANCPARAVLARREGDEFFFESSDPAKRFRWIADLKFSQAQRVVQALASETARVGLTETEWLRRSAK